MVPSLGRRSQGKNTTRTGIIHGCFRLSTENNPGTGSRGFVPFAVFPEENLGVRVEDTILITEDGCENLTAGIPREIAEIEALMKKPGIVQVLKKAGLY